MWWIRAARPDEGSVLSDLALRAKASWGYSSDLVAAFAAELTLDCDDLSRAFVAESNEQIMGFHALEPGPTGGIELGFLFVEPAFHHRGIGASLLRHACEVARGGGHRRLVIQGDPHAAAFYERIGAQHVGQRMSASVEGRMLPLYEIRL